MASPNVTILLTAFNTRPDYLQQAVASALAQQSVDLEVLIIDDGSIPPLAPCLASITDPRIRYHRLEHRGLPHALIQGVELARGKYIAILDHDDILPPNSVKIRLDLIEKTGAGLSYGNIELISPEGKSLGIQRFPTMGNTEQLVRACLIRPVGPLKHGAILFSRSIALDAGNYDPALPIEYDLDLILNVIVRAGFAQTDAVVARYRIHPGNFSRSFTYRLRQIVYRWRMIDKHMDSKMQRIAFKLWVAATNLAKGLWQGVTYRRPTKVLNIKNILRS